MQCWAISAFHCPFFIAAWDFVLTIIFKNANLILVNRNYYVLILGNRKEILWLKNQKLQKLINKRN